jgi:hypothetical protein
MGNLMKIIGIVQGLVGAAGTAPTGLDKITQTAQGGDIFNLISGAALSYLGMKGSAGQQKVGIPTVSGLNGIVGLLGLLNNNPLAGLQMNNGTTGSWINIAIAVIGFIISFTKKKAAK